MAKRMTDTEIWDKPWFMSLSTKLKCLVKYTRDKCDISGVLEPNWVLANTFIGEDVTEEELLKIDGGKQFIKLENEKIFCVGFIEFQYGQLGDKSPIHKKVKNLLLKHGINEEKLIRYSKGILRVSNTLQEEDKEEVKEKVKEEDKEKCKKEITYPFDSKSFLDMWGNWKEYRLDEFNLKYKSVQSEQSKLTNLANLSGGNEQLAIDIIQQSMSNQWKGFFSLKENYDGNSKSRQGGNNSRNQGEVLNADYKTELANRISGGSS